MKNKAGFSLIEILVAVLILGLGLLGIGALFPVVIREQRNSLDVTMGVVVGNTARDQFRSIDLNTAVLDGNPGKVNVIVELQQDDGDGPMWEEDWSGTTPGFGFGEWYSLPVETRKVGNRDIPWAALFGVVDSTNKRLAPIPLANRLYPAVGEAGGQPQYVWDVAIQRVPNDFSRQTQPGVDELDSTTGNPTGRKFCNQSLRAAIFVRRIDPRIRVNSRDRNMTLARALLDPTIAAADMRVPVGVDEDGMPTFDGTGGASGNLSQAYSLPITVGVRFDEYKNTSNGQDPATRHRLYFDRQHMREDRPEDGPAYAQRVRLASQLGQKLVDNLGNIYTVIGAGRDEDSGDDYVLIDPGVPTTLTRAMAGSGLNAENNRVRAALVQVVFTPQIPAAVVVTEVK